MKEVILIGRGKTILEVPEEKWRQHLSQASQHTFSFMTSNHQLVRNFAVRELPRNHGQPLKAEDIALRLDLPVSLISAILEDLQKNLFFLVRNNIGEINWAFPVTCDTTPHRLSFSSGERVFAAWAEDALATPFVQGRLREENLVVEIETACAHCGQEIHLTVDSEMHWSIQEPGVPGAPEANPLLFVPEVDWKHFAEPNIIDAFWRNSVFFWSEEHARAYRASRPQVDGTYMTLAQGSYYISIAQSALFGFQAEKGVW